MEEFGPKDRHLPVYNIKAVSRLSGLLPVTLRAWERRYGLPRPIRGDQGYRLYSDHDVRTLRWLKAQIDSGLSISRAVEYLHELRAAGQDPAESQTVSQKGDMQQPPVSVHYFAQQLYQHLVRFEETEAAELIRRAFSIYSMEQVLANIFQPTLVELGERWHRGELPIAIEHYATQFFMQNLMSLLAASAPPSRPGVIIAACAPGEMHQIGILMLVLMLRWRGWDVKYLGPDLKLERLEEALNSLRPRLLLFSATRPQNALSLNQLPEVLAKLESPQPVVILGGQAFENMRLPESVSAIYLDTALPLSVAMIEEVMLSTGRKQH